jgi:putative FmdB family regulatory protein
MPIYAYRCTRCGHELDALQKLSEPALTDCPACHEPALVKKLTAAGFQLKGSGWYQTDFRQSPKPAASDAKADAKTDAKADAKPASPDASSTTATETKSESKAEPSSPAPAAGCGSGCSCH